MKEKITDKPEVPAIPEVIYPEDMECQMMIQAYSMRAQGNNAEEILAGLEMINLRCEAEGATGEDLQRYVHEAMSVDEEGARKEADRLNKEFRWAKEDWKADLVTTKNGMIEPKTPPPDLSVIRADDLARMDIKQPLFIVKDILPAGLVLLASPPKYGKSWLMLDLCTSVAMGKPFLGHATTKCNTLYLALEDSEARLKDRLVKVMRGQGDPPRGCAIATQCADIANGFIQQITKALDDDPELKLIVVDTFQKIRSGSKRGEDAYSCDYRESGMIKEVADKHGAVIVLVTHLRKMNDPSDPFANISGTTGLTGAADTMITLKRESRADDNTIMSITGRDVEMNEWYLNFDKYTYKWKVKGTVDDMGADLRRRNYEQDPIVRTIKQLLEENPDGWTGRASEFKEECKRLRNYTVTSTHGFKKEFTRLKYDLVDYDDIHWDMITRGRDSGSLHHFQYGYAGLNEDPEESEEDSQEFEQQDLEFD